MNERRIGRWTGPGWRVFTEGMTPKDEPAENAALALAWEELRGANGQVDTQRITGAQWGTFVLFDGSTGSGLSLDGLACDIEAHGRKVGIRFRIGSERAKGTKFGVTVLDGIPANHAIRGRIKGASMIVQTEALA